MRILQTQLPEIFNSFAIGIPLRILIATAEEVIVGGVAALLHRRPPLRSYQILSLREFGLVHRILSWILRLEKLDFFFEYVNSCFHTLGGFGYL